MKQKSKNDYLWIFFLELGLALFILPIVFHSTISSTLIRSASLLNLLDAVCLVGCWLYFLFGILTGVVGIKLAKSLTKPLRISTTILSCINLVLGIVYDLVLLYGILLIATDQTSV